MTGIIHIEGEVGTKVTLDSVKNDIALYPEATEFEVEIQSGGGDVDEGYAIGGLIDSLRAKGIKCTAKINSLCASIATYIACSCDRVEMGSAGDFTIHLPTGTLSGNADDLRRGAARLDRIKSELIAKYMRKVSGKLTPAQVSEMIEKETSMSPQEAQSYGFIDVAEPKMKIAAYFKTNIMNDEVKGLFEKLGNKLDLIIGSKPKFKNLDVTLADGSVVQSDAADVNAIIGSMVIGPDGAPLPDGTYETADGYAMDIVGGKVDSYEPITADSSKEMEALKQENEALKKQIATSAEANKKTTEEAIAKIEAKQDAAFRGLKADFEKLKNQTFGDASPAKDADDKTKVKSKVDPQLEQMYRSLGALVKSN